MNLLNSCFVLWNNNMYFFLDGLASGKLKFSGNIFLKFLYDFPVWSGALTRVRFAKNIGLGMKLNKKLLSQFFNAWPHLLGYQSSRFYLVM